MMICQGQGDPDHCCYIGGQVCGFLFINRGGAPRCSLFDQWGDLSANPEWRNAPVGAWFAANFPGHDCGDWPQNIPAVMNTPETGKCCYG